MTNEEKYKEIFGMDPDLVCPTLLCSECPLQGDKPSCFALDWWESEYKENKECTDMN